MMEKELVHQTNLPKVMAEVRSSPDLKLSPLSELFYPLPITPDKLTNQSSMPVAAYKNFICLSTQQDSTGQNYSGPIVQKYMNCVQEKKLPASREELAVKCQSERISPNDRKFLRSVMLPEGTGGYYSPNDEKEIGLKRHHGENDVAEDTFVHENGLKRLKKGANRENTAVLRNWLDTHRLNPYPTKDERDMLAVITGLSQQQISTWFANARRRLKKQNPLIRSTRNRQLGVWQKNETQPDAAKDNNPKEECTETAIAPTTSNNPFHASPSYWPETNSPPSTPSVEMTHLVSWAREHLRMINWFNFFTQFYQQAASGSLSEQTQRWFSDSNHLNPLPASSDSIQKYGCLSEQETDKKTYFHEDVNGRKSEEAGVRKDKTDSSIWSVAKIALSSPRSGMNPPFWLEPAATVENMQRAASEKCN
uniref:Iroquois-class homeodomain protein IRX-5 n=2 Tax=Schistocephalus solidus TaxID=70667 RepID=A0A0V0J5Y4_SCHSO